MPLHTSLSSDYRYFIVADILVNGHIKLTLRGGKLVRTGYIEDTIQRFGHVWGRLLSPQECIPALAPKFIEECQELTAAWTGFNLPDDATPDSRESGLRHMAEEYADILTLLELARKLLPQAALEGYAERNAALVGAHWLELHRMFERGDDTQAVAIMSNYLATTEITLRHFMQREAHKQAWQQVQAIKSAKARSRGLFEGWTIRAMALPATDPVADMLAANPGWTERPVTDAPSLAKALDLSAVLSHRTPIA